MAGSKSSPSERSRLLDRLQQVIDEPLALDTIDEPEMLARDPHERDMARGVLLLSQEAIAALMSTAKHANVDLRSLTFGLLDQLSRWQCSAINAYAQAVNTAIAAPATPAPNATPRRRRKASKAA